MKQLSRRSLIKAAVGLVAFIPAARSLAAPLAAAAFSICDGSCYSYVFTGTTCDCKRPSGDTNLRYHYRQYDCNTGVFCNEVTVCSGTTGCRP